MELGAYIVFDQNIEEKFKDLIQMGLYTCQLEVVEVKDYTQENALWIKGLAEKYGVKITAFWCKAALEGPCVWNFVDGPGTIGLVPTAFRHKRVENMLKGSDFAKVLGVEDIITHVGFLPENPSTTEFQEMVAVLKYIAKYCKANGQYFLFETGQETPVTLRRTIEAIGMDNLGINLDPANLILYGKGNPIDALSVFGEYVRGIHAKDGDYPTTGIKLGRQKPLGEGSVDFPRFISKLKEIGYNGALTIEREITGEEQRRDIIKAKELLEKLL